MAQQQQHADGDSGFSGINGRLDPATLPPGVAAHAENCRFRNGVAESRKGVVKPAWCNNINPATTGNAINPFTTIYGAGVFRDPNSLEYILFAADGDVYFTRQNNAARKLTLPTGVKVYGPVTFTQAFNKILMFRGTELAPLVLSDIGTGFEDLLDHWESGETYLETNEVAWGPWKGTSSVTFNGGTVTVTTSAAHGYITGADITVKDAAEAEYNGRFNITVTGDSTFTYAITGTPSTPATGTVEVSNMSEYWQANASPNTPTAGEEPSSASTKWTQQSDIMPNADAGIYIQNRLAVITSYDTGTFGYTKKADMVYFSDILDHVHTFFNQQMRINQGDDAVLVELVKLNENQVLAFKDKSVSVLTGIVVGDGNALGQSISQETLISNYGLAARGAATMVGTDCYFYASRRGVVSITQTEQNKARGVDVPLSESIQPIIDRVDPRFESKIRMEIYDSKLYVALPLDDGSAGNNAIAVFDFLSQSWSSLDTGVAIKPKEFFKATFSGTERLFFTSEDGFINLVEEDELGDHVVDSEASNKISTSAVAFKLLTRGYHAQDLNHRFFRTARLSLATNKPKYSVSLLMDGVGESQALVTDQEKDRTKYYRPFDADDYKESNIDDNHATAYRQDYSIRVPVMANNMLIENGFTQLLENGDEVIEEDDFHGIEIGSGIAPWKMQETLEPFTLSVREGRFGQLEITNSQGRIMVKQATMTTASGSRTINAKA